VDGFHLDAGSRNVIEIHGNLRRLRCTACARRETVSSYAELQIPPSCPDCGALVRPEVVLFGEALPQAALIELDRELALGFDMVVVIGTTAVFPYIAAPVVLARRAGIPTLEINPGDSVVSDIVENHVRLGAREGLELLWAELGRLVAEGGPSRWLVQDLARRRHERHDATKRRIFWFQKRAERLRAPASSGCRPGTWVTK
jgi:NAD-dependent deacetylase